MFRDGGVAQLLNRRPAQTPKSMKDKGKYTPDIDNKRLMRAYQACEFSRFIGVSRPIGSEAFLDPFADLEQVASSILAEAAAHRQMAVGIEGIAQQAGGNGIGRRTREIGQPHEIDRAMRPDLLLEDLGGQFARTEQLAAATRQDDAAGGARGSLLPQAVTHQLEGLLEPRPDDAGQHRTGYAVHLVRPALAKQ